MRELFSSHWISCIHRCKANDVLFIKCVSSCLSLYLWCVILNYQQISLQNDPLVMPAHGVRMETKFWKFLLNQILRFIKTLCKNVLPSQIKTSIIQTSQETMYWTVYDKRLLIVFHQVVFKAKYSAPPIDDSFKSRSLCENVFSSCKCLFVNTVVCSGCSK